MTARLPRIPFLRMGWIVLAVTFVVPVVAALILGGVVASAGCVDAAPAVSTSAICAPGGGVATAFVARWATVLIAVLFVGVVASIACGIVALLRRGRAPWFRPAALLATVVVATLPAAVAGISVATAGSAGPLNGATFAGLVGAVLTLVAGIVFAAVARAAERRRADAD
ncbi:hypothetical protein PU630_13350 [Microbacterium horticulturae]|uniref:Uncharacterized protein n=1 Tax=Microbacterium horticulturae TaxID=3028316 RepID=A0ABY8BVK7_9MICO|nr:hypothetical protein [Microbacterium sp. KACC 23027]WEG08215.1 hypothetical protein PU630_13350 [Microbacterium sp. KACC 23027]